MKLRFTKMQGLGNDFVVIDAISQRVNITPDRARRLADRHFGVGCDQVLVVEAPAQDSNDFRYRIFNHDGNEVENCGNGARCFAVFVRQRKLTGKYVIRAETAAGVLVLNVLDNNQVKVDMGLPQLEPSALPFSAPSRNNLYTLPISEQTIQISAVSMGNPHAVTLVDDVERYDVAQIGAQIESHSHFPKRVNAGFLQVLDRAHAKLRVYERGVGETLACGTGACAAAVAGQLLGKLNHQVEMQLQGGTLIIEWQGEGHPVYMSGPAETVFHGQINI